MSRQPPSCPKCFSVNFKNENNGSFTCNKCYCSFTYDSTKTYPSNFTLLNSNMILGRATMFDFKTADPIKEILR